MSFYTHAFETVSLSDVKSSIDDHIVPNKWNLLTIWALDCVACEQQKPKLSQYHSKYGNLNIIGVSIDGKAHKRQISKRLREKPVSFDNYIVDYERFTKQYLNEFGSPFLVTPTYVLYSPQGRIEGIQQGPINFGRLKKIIKPTAAHSIDLLR